MLLYDIYYRGAETDSDRPLPSKPAHDATFAACRNGEPAVYQAVGGEWVASTPAELHAWLEARRKRAA